VAGPRKERPSLARLLSDAVDEASGVVDDVLERLPGGQSARVIKRYANRKLYDTANGGFTTLAALEDVVRSGVEVVVIDHDSGEDMTQDVLAQIVDRVARTDRGSSSVLSSFIRSPERVAQAVEADKGTKEELADLREQVAELTALVGQLVAGQVNEPGPEQPR